MASKSILILDDDEFVRRTLLRMLAADGYRVEAIPGKERLPEALAQGPFAAAMIDVGLAEDVDGVEVALGVRAAHPGLPIVMMSGDPESLDRARAAGFELTLAKPFTGGELARVLSRAWPAS